MEENFKKIPENSCDVQPQGNTIDTENNFTEAPPVQQGTMYNSYNAFKEHQVQASPAPQQQNVQYSYPQYQPVVHQQVYADPNKKVVPPLSTGEKKIVWAVRILIIVMCLFFVYGVIAEVVRYRKNPEAVPSQVQQEYNSDAPELSIKSKSEGAYNTGLVPDSNGKYNAEQVAELVSPSIVEISLSDESGNAYGGGSGIVLSEDGYILTNAHVVSDSNSIAVRVYGEEIISAELIGYDAKSDIAIIRADSNDLIPAVLGDAFELNVGEEVVAIGSPAGLTSTVTSGIVSAKNRQIRNGTTGFYMDCIQTDAAISPGNSGGALVNMYGQVVGITSSKYASAYSGTYEGLGFAISINDALPIAQELMDNGYIEGRVRMGITFGSMEAEAVQAEFCSMYGALKAPSKGIWITVIDESCDIANTELEVYDIIYEVNGMETNNYDELQMAIDGWQPGEILTAKCRRYEEGGNYKDFEIEFTLMEDTSGDY